MYTRSVYHKPTFKEAIHISKAFYDLPLSLVLYTCSLIDPPKSSQVGLRKVTFSKTNFIRKCMLRKFCNKCFKICMDNINVVKETAPTVEKKPLVLVYP